MNRGFAILDEAEASAEKRTRITGQIHAVYHCDDDRHYHVVQEGGERPGTGGTLVCFYKPRVERVGV